jgi:alkylresorcinol/alkylpyrone synthase
MPILRSVATALPPYQIPQHVARSFARQHFAPDFPAIERYLTVFEHAQIETRSLVAPPEWFQTTHSFGECNDLFMAWATRLAEESAQRCLAAAGLRPGDVNHLFFVSTTGLAAPSIDAYLINRLAMDRHTRRTPIWGLGCAGGVAGLARAYEYTLAYPHHRALLLSVELCSITFQWNDLSKRNLIAASLFSDGAAAVLVEGDAVAHSGDAGESDEAAQPSSPTPSFGSVKILGSQSTLWSDTLDIMGWDIVDTGMQVVFSSRIPHIVRDLMRENVVAFLEPYGLALDDIGRFILHPGGAKVIQAYEQALQIDPERLQPVREILRRCGNMSSATIFFVYEEFARQMPLKPGEYGLLAVLGPGFSSDLVLVQG